VHYLVFRTMQLSIYHWLSAGQVTDLGDLLGAKPEAGGRAPLVAGNGGERDPAVCQETVRAIAIARLTAWSTLA
jgi:hypothetical protein